MAELQPLGSTECQNAEPDPASYVILPGLELAKAKEKVVLDIHKWIRCFAIYLSVMATKQPTILPEVAAYMLFIIKCKGNTKDRFGDSMTKPSGIKLLPQVRKSGQCETRTYAITYLQEGHGLCKCAQTATTLAMR